MGRSKTVAGKKNAVKDASTKKNEVWQNKRKEEGSYIKPHSIGTEHPSLSTTIILRCFLEAVHIHMEHEVQRSRGYT